MAARPAWHLAPLTVLLVIGSLILISCSASRDDGSVARVRESGKIVVGIDPSYPPFSSLDADNRPVGFEIDLASEIARQLGVTPQFVSIDVGSVVDALRARKLDIAISGLSAETAYGKAITFSKEYFDAGQVIVAEANGPSQLADLSGRTVGVESGSVADLELRKQASAIGHVNIRSYATPQLAMEDVERGVLDAAATDMVDALVFQRHDKRLVLGAPLTREPYSAVLRTADQSLIRTVNVIIDGLDQAGYLHSLEDRWLH